MARKGGLSAKNYRETRGMKVSGGQTVKGGTMLTREGHKWHAGLNVLGLMHLTAGCSGEVYFTKKRAGKRVITTINIRPVVAKVEKKTEKKAEKKVEKKVEKKAVK